MKFFQGRSQTPKPPQVEWTIDPLITDLSSMATEWEQRTVSPALARARWGDICRDADVKPPLSEDFARAIKWFDAETMHRLWFCINLFDAAETQTVLKLIAVNDASRIFLDGIVPLVVEKHLLTAKLFRQSELRCEEFIRWISMKLKIEIRGESPRKSADKLDRLDYSRLVREAEKAKSTAAERMAYLNQKLEEEQARRRPRGKW